MKNNLVQQIAAGNTGEAIDSVESVLKRLQEQYYSWAILKAQYEKLKSEQIKGTITPEDFILETNKINSRVLENHKMLDDLIRQEFEESEQFDLSVNGFRERLQGQLMDRYQLLEVLGEADSVIFYKAKNWNSDQLVTIKALTSQNLTHESKAFAEFDQVRYLKHRNIRAIIDDARSRKFPKYVILEYIEGTDLQAIVESTGSRPGFETKYILQRICDAIYYLHKRLIFNCDMRPSRIMIDIEGEPILTLATGFKTKSDSNYFEILSDFQFMSPERLSAKHGVLANDVSSNQFSLGVLAYFLVTGQDLFSGSSLTDVIEQRQKFTADPEFRAQKFKNLRGSKDLGEIIMKLLSPDKKLRYPSIKSLIDALNSCMLASKAHNEMARQSYLRCTARTPNIISTFTDRVLEKMPVNQKNLILDNTTRNDLERSLRNCIGLVIETNVDDSYRDGIKQIKGFNLLTRNDFTTIFGIFYGLLEEYDYMWSSEIQEAWEITLGETIIDLAQ